MWVKIIYFIFLTNLLSCKDHSELVKKSVSKAVSITEVTSMGRDDDDGKAKKWHIGGGEN